MKKLLLAAVAAVFMAGCSEVSTSPSAPKAAAKDKSSADSECRSGYVVAYDENGNPYCTPTDGFAARIGPKS